MKHSKKWVFGGLLLALTQLTLAPVHADMFSLSEADEIAAGKQMSQQALQQYGGAMAYNHPYSKRVRAIGAQMARLSTRKNIPYSYTVLNDDKTLNAFSGPGGPVFVTRKLMETVSNDAELAYVLGHETGHIEHRHVVKQAAQQQQAGIVVGILGALLGRGGNSNAIGTVANVGWTVVSRGHSRKDESEADATGVRWMSELGYDPRAAISMLKKLGSGSGGGIGKYLATHPDPAQREVAVQQEIDAEGLLDVARQNGGPRLTADFSVGGGPLNASNGAGNIYGITYPGNTSTGTTFPIGSGVPGSMYPPGGIITDSTNVQLNFGAPLHVWPIGQTGSGVVMAPIDGFARWSGSYVTTDNKLTTLQHGNSTLQLRLNSTVAYLNGKVLTMPAPATVFNNELYVPIGHLAAAVGAQANLDQNAQLVRFSLAGSQGGYIRLPG